MTDFTNEKGFQVSVVLKGMQAEFYITTVAQWLILSKINIARAAIQLMVILLLSVTTIWEEFSLCIS